MYFAFGRFLREKRAELRISLRVFATAIEMDPSNYSKIERGILPPPNDDETLARIGDELQIQRGSAEWMRMKDLACADRGEVPSDLLNDQEIAAALPAFFQRVREEQLADEDSMYEAFRSVVQRSR